MVSARTELLARLDPRLITPKYVPEPPRVYPQYERPIVPIKSERLEMLTKVNPSKVTPKYEPAKKPSTLLDRAVLEAILTPRLDHLSRPYVSKLIATRAEYAHLGKQFLQTMSEKIAMSVDTIYYHNKKSKMAIENEKKMGKQVKKKKIWDEATSRVAILAIPKKIRKPPPPPKRTKISPKKLKSQALELSKLPPRMKYKRPSQDSFLKLKKKRIKMAKKHKTTAREKELAKPTPHRLRKEPQPFFGVKRAALTAEISPRVQEIAQPRPRANAPEMDLKENPYDISPAALKYKATPRIIKLAKPSER